MEISVRELKDRLSAVLRRVRQGEAIVVTSRGRAVARLTPVETQPEELDREAISRLNGLPWVRAGSGDPLVGLEPAAQLRGRGPGAAEMVSEGRE